MPQTPAVNPITYLFLWGPLLLIFYFLIIRPQKSKEKEHQKMLNSLNRNNDIVTTSGIHGTIVNVKDKTVIVRIDDNVKIELEKNCVAYVKKPQGIAP